MLIDLFVRFQLLRVKTTVHLVRGTMKKESSNSLIFSWMKEILISKSILTMECHVENVDKALNGNAFSQSSNARLMHG